MKSLLLTIIAAFSFNANAGVPGSPILGVPGLPVVDVCRDSVQEVASEVLDGFIITNVENSRHLHIDMPAEIITYKVHTILAPTPLDEKLVVVPNGVPAIPVHKGKPMGLPGDINGVPSPQPIPVTPIDTYYFFMEFDGSGECNYFGSMIAN